MVKTYNDLQEKYGNEWISKQQVLNSTNVPKSPQMIKKYKTLKSYNLPQDMWNIILSQLDIAELENVCFTNKITSQLCNTEAFWKNKFFVDKVPYILYIRQTVRLNG